MSNEIKTIVSLILPAKNEGRNVQTTIESALQMKTNILFEIIVVDDGSADGCCDFISSYICPITIQLVRTEGIGAARARNLGAEQSKGEYLIFCDSHLFFEDYWIDRLLEPIITGLADAVTPGIAPANNPNVVGFGQTLTSELGASWNRRQHNSFPTAILPGGCFIISRKAFFDVGGFDQEFHVWGYEDVEISIKLWLFGYKCYAQTDVKILHMFRQSFPYKVTYEHVYYNLLRMAYSHFSDGRIEKCKTLIRFENPEKIDSIVLQSEVLKQRQYYFSRRKYDDDWFMNKFGIPF